MRRVLALLGALVPFSAVAGQPASDLWLARSPQAFEETMLALQTDLGAAGYTVTRVQHVDIGLTQSGYPTDKYRVVFFGDDEELRHIEAIAPELLAYYPLPVVIYAEADETVLIASDPLLHAAAFPEPRLRPYLERWSRDLRRILSRLHGDP